jgi:dipeptidase D
VSDWHEGLEPEPFWRHFAALTQIPRPSHGEEQAAAYVLAWAGARGFPVRRDDAGNLAVDVPAAPGRESARTVTLQGHLDMVCEREPDSPYDPREGEIHVVRDGDWVRAEGTTLGADNGVAIAAMLAAAEDTGLDHGPLELLMTVAEEVGLHGAQALDPALVTGELLLNLDSEDDGALTIGCAGSADTVIAIEASRTPAAGDALRVTVSGGRGGHSGGDIALGHANAIKALGRVLAGDPDVRIAALDGGASRNAIPRDATAVVLGADRAALLAAAEAVTRTYARADPGLAVAVDAADPPPDAWSAEDSRRILDLLAALPVGPLGMSADFRGLVETSSSIGVAATDGDRLTIRCLSRSADDDRIEEVLGQIAAAARLAGARAERHSQYPGWRPDPDAALLTVACRAFEARFGAPPQITAVHGGLECALIGAKKPGMEMLSFGPRIEGAHAPGERLHIASAQRFTQLLAALLGALSR